MISKPNPNERIAEILLALCDVLGQEYDGASPETKLGKEWCERINYSYQEGDTFEFDDAVKLATAQILELIAEVIPEKKPILVDRNHHLTNVGNHKRGYWGGYNLAIDEMRAKLKSKEK
jgi:hypothetical protein